MLKRFYGYLRTWEISYELLNGRGDRIRTYDPLVPNQVRYQTAPLPVTKERAKKYQILALCTIKECTFIDFYLYQANYQYHL